jgi:hypothetical protein
VVNQLEAVALDTETISSKVESTASESSEITSLINLEAASLIMKQVRKVALILGNQQPWSIRFRPLEQFAQSRLV